MKGIASGCRKAMAELIPSLPTKPAIRSKRFHFGTAHQHIKSETTFFFSFFSASRVVNLFNSPRVSVQLQDIVPWHAPSECFHIFSHFLHCNMPLFCILILFTVRHLHQLLIRDFILCDISAPSAPNFSAHNMFQPSNSFKHSKLDHDPERLLAL